MFGDQKENPLGWPTMSLGEACEFFSGTGFPNEFQGNVCGMYPFYKVGDISRNVQDGYRQLCTCDNYIDHDIVKQIRGTLIPPKTVVFAKIGEALRLNRRAITGQMCLIDNNAMGIKPNENVLDLWYFFCFMLE
jgi:type I restriction enzyme S subunit